MSLCMNLGKSMTTLYFHLQKHTVERAKLALLTDKTDLNEGDRQSDHLLMMVVYKKWEKVLNEVCWLLLSLGLQIALQNHDL